MNGPSTQMRRPSGDAQAPRMPTPHDGVIDNAEHLSAVDEVALYGLGRMDHGLGTAIIEFGAGKVSLSSVSK